MGCYHEHDTACPFAFNEHSEIVQNYGCLPSPYEIVIMRTEYNKTWACHSYPTKPCVGAIEHLKEHGLPHKVVDKELLTERSPWQQYITPRGEQK